jgi:hypothetical protein
MNAQIRIFKSNTVPSPVGHMPFSIEQLVVWLFTMCAESGGTLERLNSVRVNYG